MVWWKNPCFICLCVWEIFIKKNLHSLTTPHVCPTKAICRSSWYKPLHICALLLLWASSNFVTLVRCLFILVWSRSRALHQLNFYTGSQLCHSIHPQNKTPCLMISLSLVSFNWGMGYRKEKERKDGMPKKHDPKKKLWTQKVQEKINKYSHIAMSSCYPNKRERDS